MKVKVAVMPWVADDLRPFVGTRVRLTAVRGDAQRGYTVELTASDKVIAHPPKPRAAAILDDLSGDRT